MSNEYIGKYIRFTPTTIEIMDELIQNKPGIKNYAEAVRYALLSLSTNQNDENKEDLTRKLNAMSKNIDLLTEMIAGGFHEQGVKAIGNIDETYIYQDAKRNVENKIQRSTTIRTNVKRSNVIPSEPIPEVKEEVKQEKPKAFNWPI
ncbi:hypothetical protein CEQ21_07250 (plasmid) [Niallia circulans]|uniref:Uncharacterized protein n=1 Tax=Niallia circulans TaxID=1397 RepID=A0A553SQT8_NIACI|nr:hypothetical protein [Niallia circulans]TRZ39350.1 hypothetical protein CEQ21_07250 [Niallia circulans]